MFPVDVSSESMLAGQNSLAQRASAGLHDTKDALLTGQSNILPQVTACNLRSAPATKKACSLDKCVPNLRHGSNSAVGHSGPVFVTEAGRNWRQASASSEHHGVARFHAASKRSQTAGGAFSRSCITRRTRAMITACSGALCPVRIKRTGLVTKCPTCQVWSRCRAARSNNPESGADARCDTAMLVARVA